MDYMFTKATPVLQSGFAKNKKRNAIIKVQTNFDEDLVSVCCLASFIHEKVAWFIVYIHFEKEEREQSNFSKIYQMRSNITREMNVPRLATVYRYCDWQPLYFIFFFQSQNHRLQVCIVIAVLLNYI